MARGGLIRPYGSAIPLAQRLFDAGWIAAVHYAAYAAYSKAPWETQQTLATGAAVLAFYVTGEMAGLYQPARGVPLAKQLVRIWAAWLPVVAVLLGAAFLLKTTDQFSRLATGGWLVGAPIAISVWRGGVATVLRQLRLQGRNLRTVAICGVTEIGIELAQRISGRPQLGLRLIGFFDDRTPDRLERVSLTHGGIVGTFDDLVEGARRGEVDLIYIALPLKAEPRVNALLRRLADTTASVYIVPDFFVFDLLHGRWSQLGDLPVVSIFETPFFGIDGWVKRLEDIVLGTFFLVCGAPLMTLIAIAIKLDSKGPVFFKQRRYGLEGEVIEVLKFRTMTVAEDGAQVKQATKDDQRITRVGRLLRRTSLDEIPQLLHVVGGSMSLVGPRPHAVAHNELYRKKISGYMLRHKVKPGLTGWAQVNGWRGETDELWKMEKRIEHDLEYIRRWGLLFDLQIVFLTVWGVLFGGKVRANAY
ncbi:MAG: undecaprenyl-phosphate glucose phosphotransferase [Sandaracinaceae bacterium]|nr:undecaprenyl-phosphate glucose phosphotransferase [Sandaracinaceae bacterium]